MSVAEELHKTIDELSEEQQQTLLKTVRQFLQIQTESSEKDNPEYYTLLKELLIKRYDYYKAHPETGIPADEASRRIRLKYGWSK